jgi:hypothetical protein
MNSTAVCGRRAVLGAAGAGLVAGVLTPTSGRVDAQTIESAAASGAATSEFKGRLYAAWRDADSGLLYSSFDGVTWLPPVRIPGVASSANPSLATLHDRLYVAWKGRNSDQRLWYAAFDGAEWSSQAQIPGAASDSGPALSAFRSRLYAMWRVAGANTGLSYASFDGATWSDTPIPSQPTSQSVKAADPSSRYPFSPQMIANSGLAGAGGVDQGKFGDCVFEASAAAVATTPRGRVAISQAIQSNTDSSYMVTFPGEPQRPIKVTPDDLIGTHVRDSATWADVLEAAMIISDPNFAHGSHPPANASGAADGSRPTPAQYALHLLTGKPATKDLAASPNIGGQIERALGNGQPVVAFCSDNDEGALVSGHEWTLMTCDVRGNRVVLRNPWGNFKTAGTSKAGIEYDGNAEVAMTLQQFGQFYREVTFGYAKD